MASISSGQERGARARESRRNAIIDAATLLFDQQGYERTTTAEIADAATITKMTLYRHMRSKDETLFAIHSRFMTALFDKEDVESDFDPAARLKAVVRRQIQVTIDYQREVRVFLEDMKHLSPVNREEIIRRREDFEDVVRRTLAYGMDSHAFDIPNLTVCSKAVLGSISEMYRWFDPDGALGVDGISAVAGDLFLRGLVVSDPANLGWREPDRLPTTRSLAELAAGPAHSILCAATDMFRSRGYGGTTIRQLAEDTGLTIGALYYHVGRKEDILFTIHQLIVDEAMRVVSTLAASQEPAPVVLARMIVGHTHVLATHHSAVAVMSEELKYLAEGHRHQVLERRSEYLRMFETALVRGCHRGEFRNVDTRLVSLLIVGMLNSTYRWYQPTGELGAGEIGAILAQLVLAGVQR